MCATRAILVLLFAVVACAVAIPAAQPDSPAVAPGAPLSIEEQQRSALEKRQIGSLENGPEQAEDLKASSTYGYGYYHGYGYGHYPYRPYGWGYPGYGYGYPYYGYGYRPFYPYYGYYY